MTARAVVERNRTAGDREAIVHKIDELGKVIGAHDYDRAYGMFSDRFRNRIKRSAFDAAWDQWQGNPSLGHITAMKWNQTNIIFQDEPGSGTRVASAYAWLDFEKGSEKARQPLVFRKVSDQWVIDDAPMVFPPERRTRTRGQAQ